MLACSCCCGFDGCPISRVAITANNVSCQGRYATAATGGAQHSLVLTADGLFSFGRNDSGQLGCAERISKSDWGVSIDTPQEVRPGSFGNVSRGCALRNMTSRDITDLQLREEKRVS